MCCRVLQCVAVCYYAVLCGAQGILVTAGSLSVCFSVLQCVCCIVLWRDAVCFCVFQSEFLVTASSVLQCVAVCCSVLQCVAVCCSVLQRIAVWCNVLCCVAVCCSVLVCVAK